MCLIHELINCFYDELLYYLFIIVIVVICKLYPCFNHIYIVINLVLLYSLLQHI